MVDEPVRTHFTACLALSRLIRLSIILEKLAGENTSIPSRREAGKCLVFPVMTQRASSASAVSRKSSSAASGSLLVNGRPATLIHQLHLIEKYLNQLDVEAKCRSFEDIRAFGEDVGVET